MVRPGPAGEGAMPEGAEARGAGAGRQDQRPPAPGTGHRAAAALSARPCPRRGSGRSSGEPPCPLASPRG